jgi:ssRNA-specific RNase YbeY (16S rRNA maturation enzyme)
MPVYLSNATRNTGLDFAAIGRTVDVLLAAADEHGSSVSVSFVRDPKIRELNRTFRGQDKPTDVLSFPLVEPGDAYPGAERLLGDIVISVDTARPQSTTHRSTVKCSGCSFTACCICWATITWNPSSGP